MFTVGRPVQAEDVHINADGSEVLLIRFQGAQVKRGWTQVKDPDIKRALLHPSTESAPAGVLRVRMNSPMPDGIATTVKLSSEGKEVFVVIPRWSN